jgi:hypothetical protein
MEDQNISFTKNAYYLRQERRLLPTSEVGELQFVSVIVM